MSAVIIAVRVLVFLLLCSGVVLAWVWLRRGTRPGKTLPVRVWLAIGLVTVFLTPVVVVEGVIELTGVRNSGEITDAKAFETVGPFVTVNIARWSDPTWQAELRQRAAKVGIDVELLRAAPPNAEPGIIEAAHPNPEPKLPIIGVGGAAGHPL